MRGHGSFRRHRGTCTEVRPCCRLQGRFHRRRGNETEGAAPYLEVALLSMPATRMTVRPAEGKTWRGAATASTRRAPTNTSRRRKPGLCRDLDAESIRLGSAFCNPLSVWVRSSIAIPCLATCTSNPFRRGRSSSRSRLNSRQSMSRSKGRGRPPLHTFATWLMSAPLGRRPDIRRV